MRNCVRSVLLFLFLLITIAAFAQDSSDDPYLVKMANRAKKGAGISNRVTVVGEWQRHKPNLTEKIIANGFTRYELPEPRDLPPQAFSMFPNFPPKPVNYAPVRTTPPSARRPSPPEPFIPGEVAAFRPTDVLVSIPNARPQRQPACVTGRDGTIYAVWGEAISSSSNAIMFSKSTDAGITWSTAVIVDNVGTNYSPRVAVYGVGSSARVHVAYNYVDWHVYDYYDTMGMYLGSDTVSEGDVYYCRSNTGGASFGGYQPIANNDIDLIILHFNYDEGGADISTDPNGNVAISYYGQADEGHILMIVLYIIYIIITGSLPPFWIEYTWYEVDMRASINHGGSFSSQHEIINEWFMDNTLTAHDIQGAGSSATMHAVYTATGILSLGSASAWYRQVRNPFFSPSTHLDNFVGDGYVIPSGVRVDSLGNTRVGLTDISGWGYDVWYARSMDGGYTWPSPTPVAISVAQEWEPRLRLDAAQNTFLVWSDERHVDTDVYCVWSEDGGYTLRSDQHKVNQRPGSFDQLWPGIGLFLSDSTRRLDVVWWDTYGDPNGDIYYNGANWWRTNINVMLHDSLANPMGGTVTITYTSMDVLISRGISTGYHIIYHDPGTEICLTRLSSGSNAVERWIYSETEDFCVIPPTPGRTYDVIYWNQYYTTFTTEIGNPPACTETDIPSIAFTYEFFELTSVGFTDHISWANVRGEWHYTPAIPSTPTAVERWYCPSPNGLVLSPRVAPVYYYQYKATFLDPRRLNDPDCTHPVPHFNLVQRWMGGVNVGGTTSLTDWADCGSVYEYEDPKNISAVQRWDINAGATGVVDGLGPYMPTCYHQWMPTIVLIGPTLTDPINPTYCETLYVCGARTFVANLAGTFTPWADCGSPLWMGEFTTLGWIARDPRAFDPVVSDTFATIRYGNVVIVRLENDFGYGWIVGDGDTVTSGFPLGWTPSTFHNICAVTPQEFGFTRYAFDHWSDLGDTCHDVYPISDTTYTAYFNKEYYLEILSDYGSPWGGGWWPEGAVANFGVRSVSDSIGGVRYRFLRWAGTGVGSYTGPDTSANVTMNNPITERAYWESQFRLIVTYTGTGDVVPAQSGSGWYNSGEWVTITTDSIIGDEGPGDTLRYIFDHWESTPAGASFGHPRRARTEVLMSRPYTVTAVYLKQWKFTVYSDSTHLGDPVPPLGEYWFTEGDSVRASVTSPYMGRYCLGYTGTGSLPSGTGPSAGFIIRQPSSITWHWGSQFVFTVTSDPYDWIMAMASPNPPAGTYYYIPGTMDTFAVNLYTSVMGGYRYRCDGWLGTGPAAPGGDTNWVALTISSSGELRWQFIQQARFVVVSPFDAPDPTAGVHWFDVGLHLHPHITPVADTMRCIGYTLVVGGFPTTGVGYAFDMTVSAPCSLHWNWINVRDAESLLVISDHGPVVPPAGAWNYFMRGMSFNAFASLYSLEDTTIGRRYYCQGWTGTGPVPASGDSNICPITMTSSGTLTWNWQTQFLVHVECEHDNPRYSLDGIYWFPLSPVANLWLPEGARIYIRTDPVDTIPPDSIVFCPGWRGWGDCLRGLDTTSTSLDITLTSPCSVFFEWSSMLIPLYVYSAHGDPVPSDTSYWIPGSTVDAFVGSPAYGPLDGERWICSGWTGTGDVPRTGTGAAVSFVIRDTSSITWNWNRELRLTIDSWRELYDSPWPGVGEHWYPAGDSVWGYVRSPVWTGTDTMYCIGYIGTGSAPAVSPQVEFGFRLNLPSTVTWQWLPRDSVALLYVTSPYDSPRPYGMTAWRIGTTVDATVDPFVISGGERIDCIGWLGGGSVPSVGYTNRAVFPILVDSRLDWQWSTVYMFEVRNPTGYGDPLPPVGTHIYTAGAYVAGEMRNHPYWTGSDTMYCVGFNGWGNLPPWDPHTDFGFNISMNSGLEWLWSDEAFILTVNSAYDSPWPHGTTYWIPGSTVSGARVDSTVVVSSGIRAYCVGWTGTGSPPAAGTTNRIPDFRMVSNSTITWNWEFQYAFIVTNEGPGAMGYDTPVPAPGTYWFYSGDTVTAYITTNPVVIPGDTMYCIGMTGSGSAPVWSPQDSIQFVIEMASSCDWHWLWADTVARLDVISEYDHPMPWGTTYWPLYSSVYATVDPYVTIDSVTRYLCVGFDVVGAVDSTDTVNFLEFIIDTHTVLTWNWLGQFYLTLLYEGLTTAPDFIGQGWYYEGDTAFFECETPVFDAGSYFGFVKWHIVPDTADFGDTLIFHSWIVMNQAAIATASYRPGVYVRVMKDPDSNDDGWISIDGVEHDSTALYTSWWGLGSYHDLLVPEVDSSAAGERYTFIRWLDGLPREHRVGPITERDTLFIAYYEGQYMAVIAKVPPHIWGWIYADGDTFRDEAARVFWWSPGPPHQIGVSTPDSATTLEGDTMRYFFREWRLGSSTTPLDTVPFITTDSIRSAVSYRAMYDRKLRIRLEKQPPQDYGYFYYEGDTIRRVSSCNFWADSGASRFIGVSEYDIADHDLPSRDSVWSFIRWSDFGDLIHEIGPISRPETYIAYYNVDTVVLAFSLNRNFWNVGRINVHETRAMLDTQVVRVTNEGNVPLDLGFILSDPGPWSAGVTPGADRFTLCVHLDDEAIPPISFPYVRDFVKNDLLEWATNGPSGRFGPCGENVLPRPHSGTEVMDNIWMLFRSPYSSSAGYGAETLQMRIYAKYHMP